MRLRDLNAKFERIEQLDGHTYFESEGVTIADADGICFLCPVCFEKNKGPIGTHSVICWRPRVPQEIRPGPGRWEFEGTSIDDLTLRAGSSSIKLESGCQAHFFVTKGEIKPA